MIEPIVNETPPTTQQPIDPTVLYWYQQLTDSEVPDHIQEGIALYLAKGFPPGAFVTAVLSNDLREACARADDINRHRLFAIVSWLYNNAPANSWGSPENVSAWRASFTQERA